MIDVHDPRASEFATQFAGSQIAGWGSYGIPYGCLVPLGLSDLLTAGRCVSGSREAMASFRVMGSSMAMGQAAGTAAALSARLGVPVPELNVQVLRTRLVGDGAIVDRPEGA
jgi:hypothetical protein